MPSKDYWKQRELESLKESFKSPRKLERYIEKMYKHNLEKTIKDFKKLMKPYLRSDGTIDSNLWASSSTPKEKAMLERIITNIENFSTNMANKSTKQLTQSLKQVYRQSYYTISTSTLDKRLVERAVSTPWTKDAREFSDRIWTNKDNFNRNIRRLVTDNVLKGESIQKTAKRMRKMYSNTVYNTERIIRTETQAIYNRATIDRAEAEGVSQLMILREPDCCDVCKKKKEFINTSEASIGDTIPPFHPNCRCCATPVVDMSKYFKEI